MPTKKAGVTRRVVLTNTATGESNDYLMDDEGDFIPVGGSPKTGPKRFSSPYSTLFRAGSDLMSRDRRIRGTDHRVLHALLVVAPVAERQFPARVDRVAEQALMSHRETTLSIARLIEVGLIQRPARGWLSFNPRYVWRGGSAAREEALAEKIASASGAEEEFTVHVIDEGES